MALGSARKLFLKDQTWEYCGIKCKVLGKAEKGRKMSCFHRLSTIRGSGGKSEEPWLMAHRSVFLQESGCEWREGTADPEHGGAGCSYLLPGWDCPGLRGPQMEGLAPKDGF